jgi:RNA polymerase sigma factor (sigma-70 family)
MSETDSLILAAQGGDEQALIHLLEVCTPKLRRYANHQCIADDIEEAVQDALWLLYRKLGALKALEAFSSWLFQIVRRECQRKARRRHEFSELDDSLLSTQGKIARADENLRIDISRAISSLPEHYREVLILRDVNGFSSDEVAARLRIPLPAAKSRLHRARQMVRARLQSASYEPHAR